MQNLKWFVTLFLLLGLSFGQQAYAIDQSDPKKMIEEVSNNLLIKVEKHREELEQQPSKVIPFAEAYILPYMDTARMARFVMGRFWRTASEQQQQDFVKGFTNTMIRSYAASLLALNITRVEVGNKIEERPGRVLVSSEVFQADGNVSTIVYRLFLNRKTQNWMIYDVSIEGISLLLSYRKSYGSELANKGIDQVVSEMQQRHAKFLNQKS